MAYNAGMTQITFVVPFALPPAELASDLVRALETPALAALLSRAACTPLQFDDNLRVLPHEAWLAQKLGLSATGEPAFATAAMRGFGLDAGGDSWFLINPAHIDIARNHLSIADMRRLHLADGHARALYDTARPLFDELGKTLVYGDAQNWFMRAGDWHALQTASPDAAVGMNLTDWLPTGAAAVEFRKLQNEVQMLWFEHPANVERESRALPAINSFWPWAVAHASAPVAAAPSLSCSAVPGWLAALAQGAAADGAESIVVHGELCEAAIAGDWAGWLAHLHQLEQTVFAPALAALREGRSSKVRLVLGNRGAQKEFIATAWGQRAFWRTTTLKRLLP
jgi:hypothetical protein